MLRSFRVANHKSIRDEQELLLIPAYDKSRPAVPVAGIYGANASGKSNLLDALRFMQHAVLRSYTRWEAEAGVPRTPFRLDVRSSAEPSWYVIDLILDDIQYVYGFSITDERVVDEWLHSYPRKHKRVIFERTEDSVEFGSTVPERRARSELLSSFTRDNSLLLSAAVQAKQEEVLPVYRWFREGLGFVDDRRFGRSLAPSLSDRVAKAVERFPHFIDLLRTADLGIAELHIVETADPPTATARSRADRLASEIAELEWDISRDPDEENSALVNRIAILKREADYLRSPRRSREMLFLHGEEAVALGIDEQSDGTIAWMTILMEALDALALGSAVMIDEIDASLHPRLTARLIELFRNDAANPRHAQLIFTTHDATLLGTSFGREILARDEVWFVEKDSKGATTLFPLSDFHPRKDENTERRYLGGSYGAVPAVFSDSFVRDVTREASDRAAS
jgi:uncharacterized protein